MICRVSPRRSGITLTEILISILILGVGIVSVATLFPLSILRLREATRLSRSAYLIQSASADLNTRAMLSKMTFLGSGWYAATFPGSSGPVGPFVYDPWLQDTELRNTAGTVLAAGTPVYRGYGGDGVGQGILNSAKRAGAGLPVTYDPLWWTMIGVRPNGYLGETYSWSTSTGLTYLEARFGTGVSASGTNLVRPDPNPTGVNPGFNGIYGLPRLTNLPQVNLLSSGSPPVYNTPDSNLAIDIFVSPEDIVWQSQPENSNSTISPILPDLGMNSGLITSDFRYTWMFTGAQADSEDDTIFEGNVVVFENRPLAIDPVTGSAAGEPVVEAIFGYANNVIPTATVGTTTTIGYAPQPSQTVVLRWPATMADPDVKIGSWIADVTYERYDATSISNLTEVAANPVPGIITPVVYTSQRCYWYQVAKRTPPTVDVLGATGYRSMTVFVSTPLQAYTVLDATTGSTTYGMPYHTNVALISPYVVAVFPRTVNVRSSTYSPGQ